MARINPGLMDSVCLLTGTDFKPIGTSFLYAYPQSTNERAGYRGWLVTCKHVVEGREQMGVALNRQEGDRAEMFAIPADHWTMHPRADIAVAPLNVEKLNSSRVNWMAWAWEKTAIGRDGAREEGLHEGDEILSVGFPIGFRTEETGNPLVLNFPLVRAGVLAQVGRWLHEDDETFLVDCPIFEGNSGGPICTVPSLVAIGNSRAQRQGWLVGVASRRLSAELETTGATPLDLGIVTPMDFVNETIGMKMDEEA